MKHVILSEINEKKDKAWEKLYQYYYAPLCSYAEKLIGEAGIAEDIVQECLIRMWHARVEFQELRALTSWLYRSVYRASVSVLREKKILKRLSEGLNEKQICDEQQAQRMALREEVISRFYEIVAQLPRQQQDILLYTLKGLKVQEIAVMLNISENSVKTQKKRAYLFVRDHFDPVQLHILYFFFCGDRIK